ncbi:coiled-coil domain-containing protein 83 [Pelobates fuscus]|uniref:coiled-coil domain-containing protein 83 n=1 Tax=Pelobates fuscus TaxID=191477 RepID=UPI002FE4A8E9
MGKKDKKEGKKGKKKKKQSKTKDTEKISTAEEILAFQIQIKEKELQELRAEFKEVEEKNIRYKERNERLKAEQLGHIKNLMKEAKAQEQELAKKEVVNREQVELEIKNKWEYIREQERMLEELRTEINRLEEEAMERELERDYYLEYKNVVSIEHAKQIHLLENKMNAMTQNLWEINEYFRKNLESTKAAIAIRTKKSINVEKELAAENAVKQIDMESRREIKENDWFKKEVVIYAKGVEELENLVCKIEQENLEIISRLFQCRLRSVSLSRNAFMTQPGSLESQEESAEREDKANLEPERSDIPAGVDNSVSPADIPSEEDSLIPPEFQQLMHKQEQDFQAPRHLEKKLLRIEGQTIPIHHEDIQRMDLGQKIPGVQSRSKWPVTPKMIRSAIPQ